MNKKILSLLLAIISIILAVIGFIFLPDQVVIQIGFNGQPTNVVSKYIGIIVPLAISLGSVVMYNSVGPEKETKSLVFIGVGYLLAVLTLVFNL